MKLFQYISRLAGYGWCLLSEGHVFQNTGNAMTCMYCGKASGEMTPKATEPADGAMMTVLELRDFRLVATEEECQGAGALYGSRWRLDIEARYCLDGWRPVRSYGMQAGGYAPKVDMDQVRHDLQTMKDDPQFATPGALCKPWSQYDYI